MGLLDWYDRIKGRPYVWGSAGGRTDFSDAPPGFDCSGFVAWAFYKASGGTIKLPAFTDSLATAPGVHPRGAGAAPQPGDIVLYQFSDPSQPGVVYPHTAIYMGNGMVMQSGGIASKANIAPVNQLPGARFFSVDGAPPVSGDSQPPPATMPESPPATTPGSGGGSSSPAPGGPPQQPVGDSGGAPVEVGKSWDLFTNGREGIDWIRFKLASPMPGGGDWINVRIPTPVGLAHATGWGIHDALQGWIPRATGVPAQGVTVPLAFYLIGGLVVVAGAMGIALQATAAGADAVVASKQPFVRIARAMPKQKKVANGAGE